MPLPRSLAHLKREISEKKWNEVRRWAGSRASAKKYKMPREQRPNKTVAGGTKRLASRFYQLKTVHCVTEQYLNWTKNRTTAQCWWRRHTTQTTEHIFKNCPEWKPQQKTLWAEVWKETGRGKSRFKIRDLLADDRCSQPVLDFLATTDVGKGVPPRLRTTRGTQRARHQSGSSGNGGSEKRRGEWRPRSWVPRLKNRCFSPRPLHGICGRGVCCEGHVLSFCSFPFFSFMFFPLSLHLSFPWCALYLLGTGLGGG
jgi:hypothetical protein